MVDKSFKALKHYLNDSCVKQHSSYENQRFQWMICKILSPIWCTAIPTDSPGLYINIKTGKLQSSFHIWYLAWICSIDGIQTRKIKSSVNRQLDSKRLDPMIKQVWVWLPPEDQRCSVSRKTKPAEEVRRVLSKTWFVLQNQWVLVVVQCPWHGP